MICISYGYDNLKSPPTVIGRDKQAVYQYDIHTLTK